MSGETRGTKSGGRWRRIAEFHDSSSDSDDESSKSSANAKTSKKSADSSVFKEPGTPPSSSRSAPRARATQELSSQGSQERTAGRSQSHSQQSTSKLVKVKKEKEDSDDDDYDFSMTEHQMVKSVLYYIMVVKGKLPTKKSEIIKFAMNKQAKDYKTVINKVAKHFRKAFGMRLIGMKNGPGDLPVQCNILEATSFILISCLRQEIIAMVTPNQTFPTDLIKAALFLILSCSYMMEKTLEEDTIWQMLDKMQLAEPLCKRREDLKRFLKTEYIDPLYLVRYPAKETDQGDRYGWGIRAEVELSKFVILKFVAQTVGKRPEEFVTHYSKIDQDEIRRIEEEDELLKRNPRRDEERDEGESLSQSLLEDGGDDASRVASIFSAN